MTSLFKLTVMWVLFFLFTASLSLADSVPVYQSPNSLVSSGQINNTHLLAGLQSVESKVWLKARWSESTEGWIRKSLVIDEWDLAQRVLISQPAPFRTLPQWNSPPLGEIPPNTSLSVEGVEENFLKTNYKGASIWVEKKNLDIEPAHWGFMIAKSKVNLYEAPRFDKPTKQKLDVGIKFSPLSIQGEFAEIRWNDKKHFVPLHSVLTRIDFANSVDFGTGWRKIQFVIGTEVKVSETEFLPFQKIRGIKGDKDLAYVVSSKANLRSEPHLKSPVKKELSRFSPLKIKSEKLVKWAKSKTKADGQIYWVVDDHHKPDQETTTILASKQTPEPDGELSTPNRLIVKPEKININPGEITTDELFARQIFDMATSPIIPNLVFASASGVFKSLDGQRWQQIDTFEDQNFPLAFADDGILYVGPYKSIDHGNTFEQFIRWDKVLNTLSKSGVQKTRNLSMKKIEVLGKGGKILKMVLKFNEGQTQNLVSQDQGYSWSLEDLQTP